MNGSQQAVSVKERENSNMFTRARTTIGLKATTKNKLDANRAQASVMTVFIYQLVDLWERTNGNGNK